MAGLKETRIRIVSVSSTQQITSAMKMVSAAKLRRAQEAITQMRPYANKLKEILENLTSSLESSAGGAYATERKVEKILLVPVTSNRGLCGAFNANVMKQTMRLINQNYAEQKKNGGLSLICIGKKATEYFKRNNYNVISSHSDVYENLKFDTIAPIAERIMQGYKDGEFDKVEVVYNQFKNAAVQILITEQFLPVMPPAKENTSKKTTTDYIFEPGKEEIVLELIPKSLKTQLYKAVLDSNASEHGARMTAMHKATDNAKDLIKELKLSYNKARQASITKEILEIVGGAEALSG